MTCAIITTCFVRVELSWFGSAEHKGGIDGELLFMTNWQNTF